MKAPPIGSRRVATSLLTAAAFVSLVCGGLSQFDAPRQPPQFVDTRLVLGGWGEGKWEKRRPPDPERLLTGFEFQHAYFSRTGFLRNGQRTEEPVDWYGWEYRDGNLHFCRFPEGGRKSRIVEKTFPPDDATKRTLWKVFDVARRLSVDHRIDWRVRPTAEVSEFRVCGRQGRIANGLPIVGLAEARRLELDADIDRITRDLSERFDLSHERSLVISDPVMEDDRDARKLNEMCAYELRFDDGRSAFVSESFDEIVEVLESSVVASGSSEPLRRVCQITCGDVCVILSYGPNPTFIAMQPWPKGPLMFVVREPGRGRLNPPIRWSRQFAFAPPDFDFWPFAYPVVAEHFHEFEFGKDHVVRIPDRYALALSREDVVSRLRILIKGDVAACTPLEQDQGRSRFALLLGSNLERSR